MKQAPDTIQVKLSDGSFAEFIPHVDGEAGDYINPKTGEIVNPAADKRAAAARNVLRGREDRKDVRQGVKDLLDLHFEALNSTKTPDERCESAMGFNYQLEEVRALLEALERSAEEEFKGGH